MAKDSFLFIPDISGFTDFVNNTEIDHGQHIISELLQTIIDSNNLDLTVSEVEGDAVLFYKHESIPSYEEINAQSEVIFLNFHNHLKRYEVERICQCGACSTASNLSIKMVAHTGEIGFTEVNNSRKPYGADLVQVHRMLKSGIAANEYLMFSKELGKSLNVNESLLNDEGWFSDFIVNNDQFAPKAQYFYKSLEPLFAKVTIPVPPPLPPLQDNPVVIEIGIEQPRALVFEMIMNLDLRLQWSKGINDLVYDKDKLNRIGTRHQCLIGGSKSHLQTLTNDFGDDKLVYGERALNIPLVKDLSTYFILSEINDESTLVRLEVHITSMPLIGFLVKLFEKKLTAALRENLQTLKDICESSDELIYDTVTSA